MKSRRDAAALAGKEKDNKGRSPKQPGEGAKSEPRPKQVPPEVTPHPAKPARKEPPPKR